MKSIRFSETDEKEFLEGYLHFTSKIRIAMLKTLDKLVRNSKKLPERQAYYILGWEQLFLLYEAYQGFYLAFRDRNKKPFLESLSEENQNPQSIYDSLIEKTNERILKDLDYKLDASSEEQNNLIKSRLLSIISMWKNEKFVTAMKTIFLPGFNAIKHKMMVYRKEKEILFAIADIKTSKIKEVLKKYKIKSEVNIQSLDAVLDISQRLNFAIQDIIVLRLLELGVKPLIAISEEWEEVGV